MHSSKFRVATFLLAISGTLIFACAGLAKSDDLQTIKVPVIFATTRRLDKNSRFSGLRNFQHKDHGLIYGTALVEIKTSHSLDDHLKALGCELPKPKEKKQKRVTFSTFSNESTFQNDIHQKLTQPGAREVCVFVHGYNNGFDDAIASAARMEVALEQPVILFSWPSRKQLRAYTADECSAEWSVRPFQIFMNQLTDNVGAQKVMTVSHSMGNRLVNWYMQMRSDRADSQPEQLSEIVLTSPDIDRATFKNYFYKLVNCAKTVRIYVSSRDKALRASKLLHGDEGRVGSAEVPDELRWQVPSNLPNTRVVDFTAVDSGWLGHSIQFDIISSMHQKNVPGANLKAVTNPNYKGDDFVVIERDPRP